MVRVRPKLSSSVPFIGILAFHAKGPDETSINSFEIEGQLIKSLEENQLTVHYQPKIKTDSGEITGFEALVRCDLPMFGIKYPNEFLHVFERIGKGAELDRILAHPKAFSMRHAENRSTMRAKIEMTPPQYAA